MTDASKITRNKAARQVILDNVLQLNLFAAETRDKPESYLQFKFRCKNLVKWENEFERIHSNKVSLVSTQEGAPELLIAEQKINNRFLQELSEIQARYHEMFELHEYEAQGAQQINVNLSKINLTCFNGDVRQFPTFFGIFDALINKNDSLVNTKKFHYLLSVLKGEPLALVKCTP
ncbi:hypothetical protein HHI36_015284, partial [Cryptolaemus montrouzieri]